MNSQCLSTFSLLGKKASRVLRNILKNFLSILNQPLLDLIKKKRGVGRIRFFFNMKIKSRNRTSVRKWIWIRLRNAEQRVLDAQDLLIRVRAAFACQTVVVTKAN